MNIDCVQQIKYDGTPLPEDTDVETLFNSLDYENPVPLTHQGVRWFVYFIHHNQAGTVTLEYTLDEGTNWVLAYTSGSLAGLSSTDPADSDEIFIEGMPHIRVLWTNAVTQTNFDPVLALSGQRASAGI